MRTHPSRQPQDFRADIQGYRALAVLLVLVYHARVPLVSAGFIGVDVFFVISGFLITSHLLKSLKANGLKLSDFWARRARRLLPASFTVLLVSALLGMVLLPPVSVPDMLRDAVATSVYAPNILFAIRGVDYLATDTPSLFQHYWSLGVEEQFYFLWPLVLWGIFALCKRSVRSVGLVIAILSAGSFVLSVAVTDWRQPWAFFLLPTRAWEFGIGALVAIAVGAIARAGGVIWRTWVGWGSFLGLVLASLVLTDETSYPSWYAGLPVLLTAAGILTGAGAAGQRTSVSRLLGTAPFQYLGKISYSLYLVHWPLLILAQAWLGPRQELPVWASVALCLISVPIAHLLWKYVEEPGRRARWAIVATPARVLTITVAGAAAIAVGALVTSTMIVSRPPSAVHAASQTQLSKNPVPAAVVPEDLVVDLLAVRDDNPVIYSDGCHRSPDSVDSEGCRIGTNAQAPTVALFGDSHAASWHPALAALAENGAIQLDSHTKSGCPSVGEPDPDYPQCQEWRDAVLDGLRGKHPDVVIIANATNRKSLEPPTFKTHLEETIHQLPETTQVIIMSDVPYLSFDPVECLSSYPEDADSCVESAAKTIVSEMEDTLRLVAEETGAFYLDVRPYLCADDACPVLTGNTVMYRDQHHLTASFSSQFAPVLQEVIDSVRAGE